MYWTEPNEITCYLEIYRSKNTTNYTVEAVVALFK
jgi:hypothetical protein